MGEQMTYCGRHMHNTAQGAFECSLYYADKRLKRDIEAGIAFKRHIAVDHNPAVKIIRGNITIFVYREGMPIS